MLTDENKKNIEKLGQLISYSPHLLKNYCINLGNELISEGLKSLLPNKAKKILQDLTQMENKKNDEINKIDR